MTTGSEGSRKVAHNIISLLDERAALHPDRVALIWRQAAGQGGGWGRMSYRELADATARLASGLEAGGLHPGERIFLFVPMSPALYIALFGVLRLGAVGVFLDSWARRDQLAACARQVEPAAFIGPEAAHGPVQAEPAFAAGRLAVRVGPGSAGTTSLDELMGGGTMRAAEPVLPTTSALVTFTTGSSGEPKGADRTHGFLAAQHAALDGEIPYRPDDVDLPVFPIFSLNNLAAGVTTALPDVDLAHPSSEDGGRLLRQMAELDVTCATLSPSLLRAVLAEAPDGGVLPRLRRLVTGGAPIGLADVRAFDRAFPGAELHILYGSTEVEPIAHLLGREMPPDQEAGVCVGAPSPHLRLRFVRPWRDPIALGPEGWTPWEADPAEGGELLVSGPHVCPGYFRNPSAFARAKVVDRDGAVWHRTGDVCRLDGTGRLWMLGRVHNAVHRAGRLHFPVEPEMLMRELPGVERAAYLGVPHDALGEAALAVFTATDGPDSRRTAQEIRSRLQERDIPVDGVLAVEHIPMDPRHHSKVDVDALRERLAGAWPEPESR